VRSSPWVVAIDRAFDVLNGPTPSPGLNAQTAALFALFESQGAKPFERIGLLRTRRIISRSVALQGPRAAVGAVEDLLVGSRDGLNPAHKGTRWHPIAHQVLLYPCLFPAKSSPFGSYRENAVGYSMTAASMEWFWSLYLRHDADGENPLAAPLMAEDLAGLPSATVVTAEFDPLRDEGRAYGARLEQAGVDVALDRRFSP
jgi:CubicO group peptidase (beta-lactamase class C family)